MIALVTEIHCATIRSAQARVEGIFELPPIDHISDVLVDLGIEDEDGGLIVAREVNRNGRSVARINGRAVPLSVLPPGFMMVNDWSADVPLTTVPKSMLRGVTDRAGGEGVAEGSMPETAYAVALLIISMSAPMSRPSVPACLYGLEAARR